MRSRFLPCPTESAFAFDNLEARITVNGRTIDARVLEIAPREIKLLVPESCGRWLSAGVRLVSEPTGVDSLAIGVIHWVHRDEDGWQLGIWLDEEVNEDVVTTYWQDMRRELRYQVNWGAVAQWPDGSRRAIQITNYSLNGMRFSTSSRVANTNEFLLWNSFDPCAAVTCGVASWSSASGSDRYIVGCNLADQGGYALARAFTEPLASANGESQEQNQFEAGRALMRFPAN